MTSWTIFSSMTLQRDNAISWVSVKKWNGWRFVNNNVMQYYSLLVSLNNDTIVVILTQSCKLYLSYNNRRINFTFFSFKTEWIKKIFQRGDCCEQTSLNRIWYGNWVNVYYYQSRKLWFYKREGRIRPLRC